MPNMQLAQQRNLNFYNVKDYGATGNGTTVDLTAINAAYAAATTSGGTVFFPPGNYKINDVITYPVNVSTLGAGDGASIITQSVTNKDIFKKVDPYNISISNLKLVGFGSGTGKGINFSLSVNTNMMLLTLDKITVESTGSDGVYLENPIVSNLNRVNGHLCGGYAINLVGVGAGVIGTSTTLTNCYADTVSGAAGIRLYSMNYCSLVACASDANTIGYLIDTCQGVSLVGCGAESCVTNSFKINAGYGVSLDSCWVYDNKSVGIWVTGSAAAVVLNGIIDNSPHAGAVNFLKVDTGCNVSLNMYSNVTANSIAAGTTVILNDGATNTTIPGTLALTSGALIDFGSPADTNIYRQGVSSLGMDGSLSVYGGLVSGNITSFALSGTSPTLASSGTIATANLGISRVSPSGAVTGVILESGTVSGQMIVVMNQSANQITFAAAATSHVIDGTSDVIAANNARLYMWNDANSRWYPCK